MTRKEQLDFLLDILCESGKWSRGENDPTGVELEIAERIRTLAGPFPVAELKYGGLTPPEVEDTTSFDQKAYIETWKSTRRRVKLSDGRYKWFPKEDCIMARSPNGRLRWMLKSEVKNENEC